MVCTFHRGRLRLIGCAGFQDESVLLKHELAYCLGQMKDITALPILGKILEDELEDPMVRHEVGVSLLISNFLLLMIWG